MNQVSRQQTKTNIERNFYKLLNNSNFGFNCRNSADICFLNWIFDEIEQLSSARRHQSIFEQDVAEFLFSELLECQFEKNFSNKITALDPQDEYYELEKTLWKSREKEIWTLHSL